MSSRVTIQDLGKLCARLNKSTGSPAGTYIKQGDKYVAQPGNYHIEAAYGGVCLSRISDSNGATSSPLNTGFVTKRALYEKMAAFVSDIESAKIVV